MKNVTGKSWFETEKTHAYLWDPSVSNTDSIKVMLRSYVTPTPVGEYDGHIFNVETQITEWAGVQPDGSFKLGWKVRQPPAGITVPEWIVSDSITILPGKWFVHPSVESPFKSYSSDELSSKFSEVE